MTTTLAEATSIICLLVGNPVDRRLLTDFLHTSNYTVNAAWDLLEPPAGAAPSLVLADEYVARRHIQQLLALKKRSGRIFLPLVVILDGQADSAPWLLAGFDDVLRQPLIKAELAARLAVLLRLREQTIAQNRAESDLRNLSAHLHTVREEERRSIARELHDELAQILAAAKMDVRKFSRKVAAAEPAAPVPPALVLEALDRFAQTIDASIRSIRTLVAELRPALLADEGLASAVEWQVHQFEQRTGIAVAMDSNIGDWTLDLDRSIAIYRILQESLTNVARHARATHVSIKLHADPDGLRLEVADNGRGLEPADSVSANHFGILGMRERVTLLRGELQIHGTPGQGTVIHVTIPFDA